MHGQINDAKHTKMFISCPFGNSLDLRSVVDLFFFLPTAHMTRLAKIFLPMLRGWKKNFFASILMGWSGN